MSSFFNQIDSILYKKYKDALLKEPEKYFSVGEILKAITRFDNHVDLYEYILDELTNAFIKIKLDVVLKTTGFCFYDFVDDKKFKNWRNLWGSTQKELAERMMMDKRVMNFVIKVCNEITRKTDIYLVPTYPKNKLWTDSFSFTEPIDLDNYLLTEVHADCDEDRLKLLSKYIDFIKVR